jgi:predicted O-methyltransferase YrrM
MTEYVNWFQNDGQKNFYMHLLRSFSGKPVRCLQIGAYTGDASLWLYENLLTHPDSTLVDVDTWEGSDEPVHHQMDWQTVESLYDDKVKQGLEDKKIIKFKGTSDEFFRSNTEKFNFIYVDGDHTAYGVLKDAVAAYECLEVGGIIAFDDYEWSAGLGVRKEPKMAIDAFSNIYGDRVEEILKGYQRWFIKNN